MISARFGLLMCVQFSTAGYERVKSSAFNLHLNIGSDGDDETKEGKLFQTRAAATGNARSPIIECFDRGMTRADLPKSPSRIYVGLKSELGRQVRRCNTMLAAKSEHCYSLRNS